MPNLLPLGGGGAKRRTRGEGPARLAESHRGCEAFGARQRREGPLVDFKSAEDFEKWLEGKPREVAIALAARAALRVLPGVTIDARRDFKGDLPAVVVLPVFRATAVSWAAAKYPAHERDLSIAAFVAASAAQDAAAQADSAVTRAARFAAAAVNSSGFYAAKTAGIAATHAAAYRAAASVFWVALSRDAARIDEGVATSAVASCPLWPGGPLVPNQPDELGDLWQEMKETLIAANQDWDVWINWYEDRLEGRVRDEDCELAYVLSDDALWKQGPAVVNAEIKRRIEKLQRSDPILPEPGPVLQVTERGLQIIAQPLGAAFDESLQKGLHDRLRRLLPGLTDETRKVANRYPALDHVVSEYSDLVEQLFDRLDVGSIWAVGTGLLAFRAAFASQASGTMTEPLEPGHMALLQQAAEIHGAFILGFPKGRELTDRADQARLSPEIIGQIAPPLDASWTT